MNVEEHPDIAASRIAAAIGEPARARMLYCLVDGRARTSTELAVVADVTPSTASVHLQRLKTERLVKVLRSTQGLRLDPAGVLWIEVERGVGRGADAIRNVLLRLEAES